MIRVDSSWVKMLYNEESPKHQFNINTLEKIRSLFNGHLLTYYERTYTETN